MLASLLTASAQIQRPKLVVGLVVDQMRWDYLYYYYDKFGEGGLRRLVDEGFSCENCFINYLPTYTAVGHSSIYTGSVPALTGIAGNDFYENGHFVYCCQDDSVQSVGSKSDAGKRSPRNMLATTMGDMLRVATDFRSKVIGVALKDRASILPAGHSANAAYWWDQSVGHFITSTFYMDKLPKWVEKFNKENSYEKGGKIMIDPDGVTMTFKMAKAALENEQLGQRGETDMLCVSVSPTDYVGHSFGTRGTENEAIYMRLDRDVADFLATLDREVGRGNYLLFLSADHGGAHNSNFLKRHHIAAGGWDRGAACKRLNAHLQEKYGLANVAQSSAFKMFLDRPAIAKAGLKLSDVKAECCDFLLRDNPELLYAIDIERAAESPLPDFIKEQVINGWHSRRSGDIQCIMRAGWYDFAVNDDYRGTNHGEWNPYDSHIPCVFFGWNVRHGSTARNTKIVDIASTVCAMLHIQRPNSNIGNPITELTDK